MFIRRCVLILVTLSLLILLVPACGDDGDEATPTSTTTQTTTATTTPTATPSDPVKLGVVLAWSGSMAAAGALGDQVIEVIEQQLEEMGGILGGRQVEFVRGDDGGKVAGSQAQARKLILQEKVDMLLIGGSNGASFQAVAAVAEELKIPFVSMSEVYDGLTMKYNISIYSAIDNRNRIAKFPIEYLEPKTIAILLLDDVGPRNAFGGDENNVGVKERWEDAGIDIIHESYYAFGTADFSPHLTKIKYENPDLAVIGSSGTMEALAINKQITALGGWGDIEVYNCYTPGSNPGAIKLPGALGTYVAVDWQPGSDVLGMKTFEEVFKKTHNRLPSSELTWFYNCIWTGIKAIEMAGTTDPDAVAQVMRSGNLQWDSAWGPLRIGPDGRGMATLSVAEVQEGGKLDVVWTLSPD